MFERIKRYIKRKVKKPGVEPDKKPKEKSPEEKEIDRLVKVYYSGNTAEAKKHRKAVAEDMYSCVRTYGISPGEYIRREFENIPEAERADYVREMAAYKDRQRYPELNNANYEMFLNRKTAMAEKFRRFYGRDMQILYDESDHGRFAEFVEKHPVFTYAPSYRIGPINHKTIDIDKTTGVDDIFDILIARSCFLIWEPLKGDNTDIVRAVTYIADDGQTEILKITAGKSGEIPDRAGAEALLKELASVLPQLRLVEWEICFSDHGWVLIDASAKPITVDSSEVPATTALPAAPEPEQPEYNENDGRRNKKNGGKTVISFTGDFSFSGKLDKRYKDPDVVDKKLLDFLNDGDAAVINFESTITDFRDARSVKTGINKRLCHRSDPEALGYIREAFKNPILSFGNNHLNDFSDIGIIDTADNAEKNGIKFIGLGRNEKEAFKYEIIGDDIKVGVFSVMYRSFSRREDKEFIGPAHEEMFDQIQQTIDDIRKRADYVVIIYHGGTEFCRLPDPDKKELVRKYLDMGCDAVVSHHPHVVQGYEYIDGKPVFYSLGNFFFDTEYQRIQAGTDTGVLLKLSFTDDGISFETASSRIDRENSRVEAGEPFEDFRDISGIDYETEWSKEKR